MSFRVAAPLLVGLADGGVVQVREWSLRALYSHELEARDLAGASLSIPFQGVNIFFPVTLEPGAAAGEFLLRGLSGRQREVLALFYRNLLSGRMAAVADVITALDTPVDLVPLTETEEERAAATLGATPRPVRVVAHLVIYALLAVAVFGYLGQAVYQRLDRVPLLNARVTADEHVLGAPSAAAVGEILVVPGAVVAAGTPLMRLAAPETRQALDALAPAIARSEAELADVEMRLAAHLALQAATAAGGESAGGKAGDAGVALAPGDYHDVRLRLEDELRARARDLRLLETEAGRLRAVLAALDLGAPVAGRVLAIAAVPGQAVAAGTPLLTLEREGARTVDGWLPDALSGAVWIGMAAEVRLTREGRPVTLAGRVADIRAGAPPADPEGAIQLRITLDAADDGELRGLLEPGAPVRATVRRDLWRRWLGLAAAAG
ncbi:MAG: HlyD family efflux transporter periplasmic adaptor subunit [Rhodobacteraceae bacterium]|nr:HlyD family efflux transporter periplasmic adaptor subunit [Paracoccaceae bacterium]